MNNKLSASEQIRVEALKLGVQTLANTPSGLLAQAPSMADLAITRAKAFELYLQDSVCGFKWNTPHPSLPGVQAVCVLPKSHTGPHESANGVKSS